MANFLLVVDPDPERRTACVARAADVLQVVPGLRVGRCESGPFAAVWAAAENAPVSVLTDARSAAVVWGDALEPDGVRVDANGLRDAWRDAPRRIPNPWDGFFAAATFDVDAGLVVGVDLLGFFPIYYWARDDVLLVASSSGAFRAHPSFEGRLDPLGLAGILLVGGSLSGVTLLKDVRRLAPGRMLVWSRGVEPHELQQYVMPVSDRLVDVAFAEQIALLDETLDRATARHARSEERNGLLLSGGRDSRVVAGLLARRGITPRALTLGERDDYEAQCAAAVAGVLEFPHRVCADANEHIDEHVRRHVAVEQLANGVSNTHSWGMLPLLPTLGDRIFSGYELERLVGGWARAAPGEPNDGDISQRIIRRATTYGIAPDQLRTLLPRDVFADAAGQAVEHIRDDVASLNGDCDLQAWQFELQHRVRFHAGAAPWRMSLGAWPTLLTLDQSLIRLCLSFPLTTVHDRRAEDALLRTRFPALARLPLDRNGHDLTPLTPTIAWRVRQKFDRRATTHEPRRYHRLFDINGTRWRAMRRLAEPGRARAAEILDPRALDALLPPPDVDVEPRYPIAGSNGLKTLLGFLIWLTLE